MIEPLYFLGVPVDFILFGLTLLGVALFHRHTLQVALTGSRRHGLQLYSPASKFGTGLASGHLLHHEWIILANLFLLLDGLCALVAAFRKEPRAGCDAGLPAQ